MPIDGAGYPKLFKNIMPLGRYWKGETAYDETLKRSDAAAGLLGSRSEFHKGILWGGFGKVVGVG
jgi:hypothetical protein